MDKRIIKFLKKHHVFTLATCQNGQPWCASMFYVFMEENATLVFTSDPATRHITEAMLNQNMAGTIALETEIIGLIRGVQCSGRLLEPSCLEVKKKVLRAYLKRFPYAILNTSPLWILELHEVKFTDNRLGFGKKLRWSRN
ncbi:MAG: pyridoxamine 5'-phosphate oxidase family protein [Bacteroidales bacterium]|nr:pyridoxamine 5'-phosphate oxidase family protein [Bacteroidales bacterium]